MLALPYLFGAYKMYDQHDNYFLPHVFNADSALKTCALQRVSTLYAPTSA